MYDAIVIGAGLGGLVSAAKLAGEGRRVLVLEKHHAVGGYATSFRRKQYEFEVSLHMLGDLGEGGHVNRIFRELGLLDRIVFRKAQTLYRSVFPDDQIIAGHADDYVEELASRFPEEREGIVRLFAAFVAIREDADRLTLGGGSNYHEAPTFMKYLPMTVEGMLQEFLSNPRLQAIMAQQWAYYGLPPSMLSATYFAYAWTEYHLYGGYYPEGRSQTISDTLRDRIRECGGEVRTGEAAVSIAVRDGKVTGVATKRGFYEAPLVVSNANPNHTFRELLGMEHLPKRYAGKIEKLKPSLSAVQAFVVLEMDFAATYGVHDHEIFAADRYDHDESYRAVLEGRHEDMPIWITVFENILPEFHGPGLTTLSLFQLCTYEDWSGLDRTQYAARKEAVTESLLRRFDRLFPGAAARVKYAELSTPLTLERYTGNYRGAIYGSMQTLDQSMHKRLQWKTPVDGLYLVGAWTHPGHGYSGVITGGYGLAKLLLEQGGGSEDAAAGQEGNC